MCECVCACVRACVCVCVCVRLHVRRCVFVRLSVSACLLALLILHLKKEKSTVKRGSSAAFPGAVTRRAARPHPRPGRGHAHPRAIAGEAAVEEFLPELGKQQRCCSGERSKTAGPGALG